ncbi:hypothetical protein FF1_008474 [Malus domestica]
MNSHTCMQLIPLSKIESLRWTRSSYLSFPRWSARGDEFEEGYSPRVGPESSSCVLGFRSSEKGETGLRRTGEMGWFDEGSVVVGDDRNLELTSRDLALLGLWDWSVSDRSSFCVVCFCTLQSLSVYIYRYIYAKFRLTGGGGIEEEAEAEEEEVEE